MVAVITLGDPAGIGPEVVGKALGSPVTKRQDLILVGDPASLPARFRPAGKNREWIKVVLPGWKLGRPSAASGRVAAESIRRAVALVRQGQADALVTAPISKDALGMAGEKFAGHTEMLAHLAGLKESQVGMMLVGGGLRVFLVTRHMALKKALSLLKPALLKESVLLAARGLHADFGIAKPRLALAALNPHAGEAGRFGREEVSLLSPLVRRLSGQAAFHLTGPVPADSVFVRALKGEFDAVVCLTHDQGLIPLKVLAFDSGVNVTLGLPFIRTSPDHGTAYDIAGKDKARPDSFLEALKLALVLARRRKAA